MAAKQVMLALVAACAVSTLVAAGSQVEQVVDNCPPGCASDGCTLDSTSGAYTCTKCQGSLVANPVDGRCGCLAGTYGINNSCADCDKGFFCLGGTYTAANTPAQTPCGSGLTTIGMGSTSIESCGECLEVSGWRLVSAWRLVIGPAACLLVICLPTSACL